MRRIRLSALTLALALLLGGCGGGGEELPGSSSPLPEASQEDPIQEDAPATLPERFALPYLTEQTLDPITCADGVQQTVGALLYEGLFRLDESFAPQKALCADYNYDEATLTYTFTLRGDVTFHDGSELTAADVATSLNRARSSERYATRLQHVAAVTAGEGVVTVVLRSANASLPALLDIPIIKSGTENSAVPLGTGPYAYMTDENGPYLHAVSGWWGGEAMPAERIELVACQDDDAVLYQFISHEIQLITADLAGTNSISTTGNITFTDTPTTALQYVGINTGRELLSSAAVRRALDLGIDRGTTVSAFLSSHGTAAQFPVSPLSACYPDQLERGYSYEAFQKAMAEAGLSTGTARRLTMLVNEENPFKVSAAKFLASALSACDLDIEVKVLPWEDFTAALAAGNFDLYYGEVRLGADWDLRDLLATGGRLNYGGYTDTVTDGLLAAYMQSAEPENAMEALCRRLREQAPILPVCFRSTSVLTQADVVEGLSPTASDPFYGIGDWILHLASDKG